MWGKPLEGKSNKHVSQKSLVIVQLLVLFIYALRNVSFKWQRERRRKGERKEGRNGGNERKEGRGEDRKERERWFALQLLSMTTDGLGTKQGTGKATQIFYVGVHIQCIVYYHCLLESYCCEVGIKNQRKEPRSHCSVGYGYLSTNLNIHTYTMLLVCCFMCPFIF